ncbi:DNA internalization-related competence protein ComEC/Rec2 [Desulforhopalus sp. 52FAK]
MFGGYLHGNAHIQPPHTLHHIYNLIEKKSEVVLTGHLHEMVTYDGKMSRAVVNLDSIREKKDTFHTPAQGMVRLSYHGRWPADILPGDYLAIRASVKRPRSFYTPGVFDYERYLAQKDIWITGFIGSPLFIQKLSNIDFSPFRLKYVAERSRTRIGSYLDKTLPHEFASLYRALLLGDRSRVTSKHLELFKATGTFHILAVSGLHIAVIATLLYIAFYFILSRSETLLLRFQIKKVVAILTIPLLLSYALLAGMNSPVTRAVIMSTIVILALCSDRKKSPAHLVAAAALLIVLFEPQQIFTVSFQLSFTATMGILFIFPHLQRILTSTIQQEQQRLPQQKFYLYIFSAFLVSLVATIVTAPITVSTFNRISTIGPFANLILEPLICLWCLPFGILALPFIWIYPPIADLLLQFGSYGISSALYIAEILADIPLTFVYLADPPLPLTLVYIAVLCSCASGLLLRSSKAIILTGSIITCMTLLMFVPWSLGRKTTPQISFLDVGQGSATIIEDGDKTILIDGGGSSFSSRTVGETVIAPYLWHKGIQHVDTIIITHPDADHYNGMSYIIEKFNPKAIWVRDVEGHDKAYRDVLALAQENRAKVIVPQSGDIIHEGAIQLQCLANLGKSNVKKTRSASSANSGLILKGCAMDTCFLLPGDINSSMEHYLIEQNYDLSADIMLSAHHGSATSNSTEFLTQISPQYAIVSAGASSKGYFPHNSFIKQCREKGITIFNTSIDGTIEISLAANQIKSQKTKKYQNNPLYPFRMEDIQ